MLLFIFGSSKTTEGNILHYSFVEHFIDDLDKEYHIHNITFDRWDAIKTVQNITIASWIDSNFSINYTGPLH
ncbi:hypothetical protein H5S40_01970 [Limosilactobacillus sp. RRLNB_1_1]|uniref:Uncharacterized protein n=1 Tax=Limosilactobacillus albertensis TaxID=2759752 RepID=A0A7W3TQD0_9LACO|nr:hypothetical protein [Limosilactobacillus albertensis]MBB1068940.1 hypothetical protein [Limosilactobacillus albertensis]